MGFCGLAIAGAVGGYRLANQALGAEEQLRLISRDLEENDFVAAGEKLAVLETKIAAARNDFSGFRFSAYLPYARENYQAINQLFRASDFILPAVQQSLDIAAALDAALPPGVTYAKLTLADKASLLKVFQRMAPVAQGVRADWQLGSAELKKMPRQHLLAPLGKLVAGVNFYLSLLDDATEVINSTIQVLPRLAGLGQERTYLVIMQNNDELRPSGGFIGVYGILKVKDGEIKDWQTADSYALDRPAEKYLDIASPAPLRDYLIKSWWFRDANWSPDFPTTAEKLIWFYGQERGKEKLDGVIAFDQDFVANLLALTGPLSYQEKVFTAADFGDLLQQEVEQDYIERGLPKTDRKDVVYELSQQLLAKIFALPAADWLRACREINSGLREKHLLFYDRQADLQSIYLANNWAGELKSPENSDCLAVIDANLGALKTDRVMDKKIDYSLALDEQDRLIATVTLTYANNGQYDYRTSRWRGYTRVYAPLGSQLVSTVGALTSDRGDNPGKPGAVDTSEELGKTVFGAFWYINPGQTKTLVFSYQLPAGLKGQFQSAAPYNLYLQKQAGTVGHEASIRVKLGDAEKTITTDLRVDRQLTITKN